MNCFLMSVLLDNTRKIGRKNFFAGKIAFFFKNLCFQQPIRRYRNDPITCSMMTLKTCEA